MLYLNRLICKVNHKCNILQMTGQIVDSERKDYLLKVPGPEDKCVLCRLNLDIKYTVRNLFCAMLFL